MDHHLTEERSTLGLLGGEEAEGKGGAFSILHV